MRLFGRKGAPEAARPALSCAGYGAMSGWGQWPSGYEAQLRAAYLENAIAQRAVRLVAEGAGSVTVAVRGARGGVARRAVARLVSGHVAGQSLLETVAMQLLLHGNAYVRIVEDAGGMPADLFALRPERVSIMADAQGWPTAYLYRAGGTAARIAARDGTGRPGLVHVRAAHPLDDHYGLGCLGAASGPVATHNAATRWNKALLDNAARPSGALTFDPPDGPSGLSPDQYARLRGELDAHFSGAGNAGRPLLLEGGLKWQALSLTPADMDFIALKAGAAREIALAFGVPPLLLGLPGDNTHANYAEANRALWRQTILPLVDKVTSALAQGLAAWWPGLELAVARDAIPALAEDRERLWRQVGAADFLSDEEKKALLGLAAGGQAHG